MPDRFIHTARSVLDGLLVIVGVLYAFIGWSWLILPTPGRLAGIEWLPVWVTEHTVGWWWIAGGLATALCAALSNNRVLGTLGVFVGLITPLAVAGAFFTAFTLGLAPRGLVTAASYGSWAVIIGWVSARTAWNTLRATKQIKHSTRRQKAGGAS